MEIEINIRNILEHVIRKIARMVRNNNINNLAAANSITRLISCSKRCESTGRLLLVFVFPIPLFLRLRSLLSFEGQVSSVGSTQKSLRAIAVYAL